MSTSRRTERTTDVGLDLNVRLSPRVVDRVVHVDHPLLRSGPQCSGPIGTITTRTPACGEKIQRIRTSGSPASARSPPRCAASPSALPPRVPRTATSIRPATRRPPSAPSRYSQRTAYSRPEPLSRTCPHALVVLFEVDQLVVEANPAPGRARPPSPSAGLEANLRKVELPARARGAPGLVVSTGAPGLQPQQAPPVVGIRTGQSGVEGRRRHLLAGVPRARSASAAPTSSSTSIARRLRTCAFGNSEVPGRRADEQMLDSLACQEHRCGQPRTSPPRSALQLHPQHPDRKPIARSLVPKLERALQ